jgi:hypothetical protein
MLPARERRIKAMLLTCKPGSKPVTIPMVMPSRQNVIMRRRSSRQVTSGG